MSRFYQPNKSAVKKIQGFNHRVTEKLNKKIVKEQMRKNVGTVDAAIRIIIGIVILVLGIIYSSWWGLIGLIPVVTGLTGRCPSYMPFGISTCKVKDKK